MRNNIILTLLASAAVLLSCQKPAELKPSVSRVGITSFTACFPDDDREENSFEGIIDPDNHLITVVVPYTYPANTTGYLEMSDLRHMRVSANLEDNVTIEPPLLFMDLSVENHFTLTDQKGERSDYTVKTEIRKSSECLVTDFMIPDLNLNGVINYGTNTISLVTNDHIGERTACVKTSFGATLEPDINTIPVFFDEEFSFSVVAQDGVTRASYTVIKDTPKVVDFGMRPGSAKILWQKKLADDIGITTLNLTGGMAVTNDYVVLNTRGEDLVYLDAKTGEKVGTIDLPFKGGTSNFYCTADSGGHIFVCNLTPNDGEEFKIYLLNDVKSAPELFISLEGNGASYGRKISVSGNIDEDAIITAPLFAGPNMFLKWPVHSRNIDHYEEVPVAPSGALGLWNYNCDIVFREPRDRNGDYLLACYGQIMSVPSDNTENRSHLWFDGSTNEIKHVGKPISSNWVPNAIDYVLFNGCPYMASNSVNSFTWGADDLVYLYDLSTDDLSSVIWQCDKGIYGSFAVSGVANGNSTGDVALRVSPDGYYMYLYFMFTNGYVVCVQFDCLNM